MSYDLALAIVACLSGLGGVVVSFWPPQTLRKRVLYTVIFASLAITGVLLVRAQSQQKDQLEQRNQEVQQRMQASLDSTVRSLNNSEREVVRIRDGLQTVQLLLATQKESPEAAIAAASVILKSLQSPFTDTGTTLTTDRNIVATTFETNEQGNGYLELTETSTGRKVTLSVGNRAPTGPCTTGSLFMVSTGGVGNTLYLCEADAWAALAATDSRSLMADVNPSWVNLIPTIAALVSFFLMMIHRRNMLETVRPELAVTGWRREQLGEREREQEDLVFERIKNVGRGAALQVHYGMMQTSDDKPTVFLTTSRHPVIAANEELEVNDRISVYWKNIESDSVEIPLSIFCFDTRGARYETRYTLAIVRLNSNIGVALEIPGAPGVMIAFRKVIITPVWKKTLGAYLSRLRKLPFRIRRRNPSV